MRAVQLGAGPGDGARHAGRPGHGRELTREDREINTENTIPYGPTDDTSADPFINEALRRPDDQMTWDALCSPTYAEQTLRVLRFFRATLMKDFETRAAEMQHTEREYQGSRVSTATYRGARITYDEWRTNAMHFNILVDRIYDMVETAALTVRSSRQGDQGRLLDAIEAHRKGTRGLFEHKPTSADRRLWKVLDELRPPAEPARG